MKLSDYKLVFVIVGLIGILLVASPTIGAILRLPEGEQFSEIWLLNSEHMAKDYPFNVREGIEYLVHVGVSNYLAYPAYYVVQVKFGNQSDPLPNSASTASSPLQNLYEYRFIAENNKTWEAPLVFSIHGVSFKENRSYITQITLNNVEFDTRKHSEWDSELNGFYYTLFVELWVFNPNLDAVQFHNRYVSLQLNLTSNA